MVSKFLGLRLFGVFLVLKALLMSTATLSRHLLKAEPQCPTDNDYNGQDELRVLSVFLILIASGIGVYFPIFASKNSSFNLPKGCFFFAKYFGSGVIIATGFVHLLEPATESLGNPCLGGFFTGFPWAFAILQIAIFLLFLFDIFSHFYNVPEDNQQVGPNNIRLPSHLDSSLFFPLHNERSIKNAVHEHGETSALLPVDNFAKEDYTGQILALFVLEFGLIFHSVFIGLSLAVAGDDLKTLLAVLVFHQLFEGMGLGVRISEIKWPNDRKLTPWLLALAFTLTTPISIIAGFLLRNSFSPGSRRALITSGVVDAFSAGILIYTGLVELMANEFLYSNTFVGKNKLKDMLGGGFIMILGSVLMTVLGKWA